MIFFIFWYILNFSTDLYLVWLVWAISLRQRQACTVPLRVDCCTFQTPRRTLLSIKLKKWSCKTENVVFSTAVFSPFLYLTLLCFSVWGQGHEMCRWSRLFGESQSNQINEKKFDNGLIVEAIYAGQTEFNWTSLFFFHCEIYYRLFYSCKTRIKTQTSAISNSHMSGFAASLQFCIIVFSSLFLAERRFTLILHSQQSTEDESVVRRETRSCLAPQPSDHHDV